MAQGKLNTLQSIIEESSIVNGCRIPKQKPLKRSGYVVLAIGGKYVSLHRWIWEQLRGPIPNGLVINHICNNRVCFEIEHLELVTPRENILYASKQGRLKGQSQTSCINGHPYVKDNTYIRKNGTRQCKECTKLRRK